MFSKCVCALERETQALYLLLKSTMAPKKTKKTTNKFDPNRQKKIASLERVEKLLNNDISFPLKKHFVNHLKLTKCILYKPSFHADETSKQLDKYNHHRKTE